MIVSCATVLVEIIIIIKCNNNNNNILIIILCKLYKNDQMRITLINHFYYEI